MSRYSLVFTDYRWVPTVEIRGYGRVVRRVRGWSRGHAFKRALAWARANGDPR